MASEIKIHLRFNVRTGKKDLVIEYESDDDALPYEHEQRHREIVETLIGKGLVGADDVGEVLVGRVEGQGERAPQQPASTHEPSAEPQGSGH